MATRGEVERISVEDPGLAERIANKKPVIIEDGAKDWPCRERWTREYLLQAVGNHSLGNDSTGQPRIFASHIDAVWNRTFRRSHMQEPPPLLALIRESEISAPFERLIGDFEIPSLIPRERLWTVNLWVDEGAYTYMLHADTNGCANLNAQIVGSKRVVLAPPECLAELACRNGTDPENSYGLGLLKVDFPDDPSEEINPIELDSTKDLPLLYGELHAGDILHIPELWFHAFCGTDQVNINLNYWWFPESMQLNATSALWTFLSAVVRVLGRRHPGEGVWHSAKWLRELPDESLALLNEIEDVFLKDPTLISGGGEFMQWRFFNK